MYLTHETLEDFVLTSHPSPFTFLTHDPRSRSQNPYGVLSLFCKLQMLNANAHSIQICLLTSWMSWIL
ncbi:hypothetical protein I3842_07G054000 [Carya illinoinensis]|uniref:Uncharacterized protein n=1 Tax=Carya illinoinensis TaxID=32201 RepID=A0A922JFX3_CARIL|nr:hypothetical protein I3842_07G054000 [Carya illinoinensis]